MIIFAKNKLLKPLLFLSLSFCSFLSYAEGGAGKPSALEQFFPFILIGLFFYFILIRPQQRRHKEQQNFLSKIKRGDEVLTNSGIYGRIEGLTDNFVILEIADKVRIRVVKSQISSYSAKTEEENQKMDKQAKNKRIKT